MPQKSPVPLGQLHACGLAVQPALWLHAFLSAEAEAHQQKPCRLFSGTNDMPKLVWKQPDVSLQRLRTVVTL